VHVGWSAAGCTHTHTHTHTHTQARTHTGAQARRHATTTPTSHARLAHKRCVRVAGRVDVITPRARTQALQDRVALLRRGKQGRGQRAGGWPQLCTRLHNHRTHIKQPQGAPQANQLGVARRPNTPPHAPLPSPPKNRCVAAWSTAATCGRAAARAHAGSPLNSKHRLAAQKTRGTPWCAAVRRGATHACARSLAQRRGCTTKAGSSRHVTPRRSRDGVIDICMCASKPPPP
jgi:hypothetical protein